MSDFPSFEEFVQQNRDQIAPSAPSAGPSVMPSAEPFPTFEEYVRDRQAEQAQRAATFISRARTTASPEALRVGEMATRLSKRMGVPVDPQDLLDDPTFEMDLTQELIAQDLQRDYGLADWAFQNDINQRLYEEYGADISNLTMAARTIRESSSRVAKNVRDTFSPEGLNAQRRRLEVLENTRDDQGRSFFDIYREERAERDTVAERVIGSTPFLGPASTIIDDLYSASERFIRAQGEAPDDMVIEEARQEYTDRLYERQREIAEVAESIGVSSENLVTAQRNWDTIHEEVKAEGGTGFEAVWRFMTEDPQGVGTILVSTIADTLPVLAAGTAATVITKSPLIGNAVRTGLNYARMDQGSANEIAEDLGYDITDYDQLQEFLADPALRTEWSDRRRAYALTVSAVDAMSIIIGGQKMAEGWVKDLLLQGLTQAAMGSGGEALGRWVAEMDMDPLDIALEGLAELALTPLEVYGVARTTLANKVRGIAYEENQRTLFQMLSGKMETTALKEKFPSQTRQLVTKLTENGPVETVSIDSRGLNQLVKENVFTVKELSEALEISENKILESLKNNIDLEVPTSTYEVNVVGKGWEPKLFQHVRLGNMRTGAEIELLRSEMEDIDVLLESVRKNSEALTRLEQEQRTIQAQIYDDLLRAQPNVTPTVARTQAAYATLMVSVMAERSGMTIEQYTKKYPMARTMASSNALSGGTLEITATDLVTIRGASSPEGEVVAEAAAAAGLPEDASEEQLLEALRAYANVEEGAEVLDQSTRFMEGEPLFDVTVTKEGHHYTIKQIGEAFDALVAAESEPIPKSSTDPEHVKTVADHIVSEVLWEMQNTPRSKRANDWYSKRYPAALKLLADTVFPELRSAEAFKNTNLPGLQRMKNPKTARTVLTALIATASNGETVQKNTENALAIYNQFRVTGNLAPVGYAGYRSLANKSNLFILDELLAKHGTKLHKHLLEVVTVKEGRKLAKEGGFDTDFKGLLSDAKTPMAAVYFGPKLGNFFANLAGDYGWLTRDRWWNRTIHRMMGQMTLTVTDKEFDDMRELMGNPLATEQEVIQTIIEAREAYVKSGYKDKTPINRRANTIWKKMFNEVRDTHGNGTDAKFQDLVAQRAVDELNAMGYDFDIAALQATMWYYEQRLYRRVGGKGTSSIDYHDAVKKVLAGHLLESVESGRSIFSQQPRGMGALDGEFPILYGDETATAEDLQNLTPEFFGKKGWAILSAELDTRSAPMNERRTNLLRDQLDAAGIPYKEVTGFYGGPAEHSFIVIAPEKTYLRLGAEYSQDSVIDREGLKYMDERPTTWVTGTVKMGPAASASGFYSITEDGQMFSLGLDFETSGPGVRAWPEGYTEIEERPGLPVNEDGKAELFHYSRRDDLTQVDPEQAGTGPLGGPHRKAGWKASFWGIMPRPSRRAPGTGYVRESTSLGDNIYKAEVDPMSLYPVDTDPDGIVGEQRETETFEQFQKRYVEALKDAGWLGYYVTEDGSGRAPLGDVAVTFKPVDVEKVDSVPETPTRGLPDTEQMFQSLNDQWEVKRQEFLSRSVVKEPVYHAGFAGVTEFWPLTHYGTARAAKDRVGHMLYLLGKADEITRTHGWEVAQDVLIDDGQNAETLSTTGTLKVLLNLENPLDFSKIYDFMDEFRGNQTEPVAEFDGEYVSLTTDSTWRHPLDPLLAAMAFAWSEEVRGPEETRKTPAFVITRERSETPKADRLLRLIEDAQHIREEAPSTEELMSPTWRRAVENMTADFTRLTGYDGIVYLNAVEDPGSTSYVAFFPSQVKLPWSRGFNPLVGDILEQSANVPRGDTAFWEWFGDSKVVDENGRPLEVLHGTDRGGFDAFDTDGIMGPGENARGAFFTSQPHVAQSYTSGSGEITILTKERVMEDPESFGFEAERADEAYGGGWEIIDPDGHVSEYEASENRDEILEEVVEQWLEMRTPDERGFYRVYLSLQNPMEIDARESNWMQIPVGEINRAYAVIDEEGEINDVFSDYYMESEGYDDPETLVREVYAPGMRVEVVDSPDDLPADKQWLFPRESTMTTNELAAEARELGHDGVIIRNVVDNGPYGIGAAPGDVYIAFDPSQIKSVHNVGTWSPEDPRIMHQRRASATSHETARGQIVLPPRGAQGMTPIIRVFKGADESTVIHELGHWWLWALDSMVTNGDASPELEADFETIKTWIRENAAHVAETAPADITATQVQRFVDTGTVGDGVLDRQVWEGIHEYFSRAHERYLFEGKPPTKGIAAIMDRLSRWMISVYRMVKNLNVEMDENIRRVFDNMLLASDAIEQEIGDTDVVQDVINTVEGPPPVEIEELERLTEEARATARRETISEVMKEVRTHRRRAYADRRERARREAAEEVNARPVQQLLAWLGERKWVGPEGQADALPAPEDMLFDTRLLIEEHGADVFENFPRTPFPIHAEGTGVSTGDLAGWFGFPDGEALINAIVKAGNREATINRLAGRILRREQGGGPTLTHDQVADIAASRIENEDRGRQLEAELKSIRKKVGGPRAMTPIAAARATAARQVRDMSVGEIESYARFRQAADREGDLTQRLLARGDFEAAFEAKRRQMVQHALFMEAREASETTAKLRRLAKRLSKKDAAKQIAPDTYEAIQGLLFTYDFRKMSKKQQERMQGLAAYVERLIEEGFEQNLAIPQSVLEQAQRKPYRTLTVGEMYDLYDALRNLAHIGRRKQELIDREKARNLNEVAMELAETADENLTDGGRPRLGGKTAREQWAEKGKQFVNLALNTDTLLRVFDGWKMGSWYEHLKKDIDASAIRAQQMREEAGQKMNELVSVYSLSERSRMTKTKHHPALKTKGDRDGRFSHWDMIALALNMGNEDNLDRLKSKDTQYGLTDRQVDYIKRQLTKKDWDFVQSVWDYLDSFWPEIAAKEKRLTGVAPKRVQPLPVDTPHGTYRGGYFPIKYASDKHTGTYDDEIVETMNGMLAGRYGKAQTQKGHTIERVGSGGRTLDIGMHVFYKHVGQVIQDLAYGEAIANSWRILHHPVVSEVFERKGRLTDRDTLKLWLEDVAVGPTVAGGTFGSFWMFMKGNFTLSKLAFSVTTTAVQVTGLAQTTALVGPKWMMLGMRDYLGNMPRALREVKEASEFMRLREQTINRDIYDLLNETKTDPVMKRGGEARRLMAIIGFYAMQKIQYYVVDVPTWYAGYRKALAAGKGEEDARLEADRTVARAQASGFMPDRTAIERGTVSRDARLQGFIRFFTALGSYMFAKGNIAYEIVGEARANPNPVKVVEAALRLTTLFAVEAALYMIVRGKFPDEDDEDLEPGEEPWQRFAKDVAAETAFTILGTIPFVRDVAGALRGYDAGGPYAAVGSEAVALPRALMEIEPDNLAEGLVGQVAPATSEFLGIAIGFPSLQVNRFLKAWYKQEMKGEDRDLLEYIMGER